jgi:hypothetical protein
MCYVRSLPTGPQQSEVMSLYKINSLFLCNRDRILLCGTKCLNTIQVKFSLQIPRTVKDSQFVERLEHTLNSVFKPLVLLKTVNL